MTAALARVLVIDDDPARAARLMRPFASWGWEAVHATGEPKGALRSLNRGDFDMALLDLEAAEREDYALLRRKNRRRSTPIVITAPASAATSSQPPRSFRHSSSRGSRHNGWSRNKPSQASTERSRSQAIVALGVRATVATVPR